MKTLRKPISLGAICASILTAILFLTSAGKTLAETVVPTGYVAGWDFSGNAIDTSGNGHDGNVVLATLTTDKDGNVNSAYSFDGGDYISVADHDDLGNL